MARKHPLSEQLVTLTEPLPTLDVSVTWARTPPRQTACESVRFGQGDAPTLRELRRSFRSREPRGDVQVTDIVHLLNRGEVETAGNIRLRTSSDSQNQSVTALPEPFDYEQAICDSLSCPRMNRWIPA